MQTITTNLREAAEKLHNGIAILLGENAPLRDLNESSSDLYIVGRSHVFSDLPLEKKRLQSRLSEDHQHFIAIVRALLRTQSEEVQRKISQHDETVREVIEQTHCVWHSSTGKAISAVHDAFTDIQYIISCLYDSAENSVVLVPDTNALIYSPSFHEWTFEELPEFELLLVPTLLAELDKLKNEHRNADVRQKAQSVIRQIKEYRRRGPLNDGVVVVANHIRLRSSAVEPQVAEVLPWLDSTSQDDRIIASCVEAMRVHPRSMVALVTGDINLQNKAEFARIPFIEPPSPVTAKTSS